jgi:hypothetical protein
MRNIRNVSGAGCAFEVGVQGVEVGELACEAQAGEAFEDAVEARAEHQRGALSVTGPSNSTKRPFDH